MRRRSPLLVVGVLGLAACGSGQAASSSPLPTVGDVGRLPVALAPGAADAPATTDGAAGTSASSGPASTSDVATSGGGTATTAAPERAERDERDEPVGRTVEGRRVLVIGDSILASVSDRYGGQLCDRLEPLGWEVEIDAEVGRPVEFGRRVLDRRLADGWDAAVVMLGNNYGGDPVAYGAELGALLGELAPRPVVLLTITEFRDDAVEVNYVIRSEANRRDHVRVLDWAARTAEADELLGDDGLHLSDDGRAELAAMVADELGRAPADGSGACLPSTFRDDAGSVTGD